MAKIDIVKTGVESAGKVIKYVEDRAVSLFNWGNANKPKLALGVGTAATSTVIVHDIFTTDVLPTLQAGEVTAEFPLDKLSGGDFWTELSFYSWKSGTSVDIDMQELNTQSSTVMTDFLGIVRLPMPLQLGTAYGGSFTEADDMHVNRDGSSIDILEKLSGIGGGFAVEMKAAFNALGNLNNTAKMASASINNNSMGMQYEGGSLRGHTFSWRLSAKNAEETAAIQRVIMVLKGMSLPANNWGGSEDFSDFMSTVKSVTAGTDDLPMLNAAAGKGAKTENVLAGGRLTIPPTVSVRFLDGDVTNPHLFKVKDSFITNVEVNYTSQGTWNPHKDGAPMEVQISITMKEVRQVTRKDVLSGY